MQTKGIEYPSQGRIHLVDLGAPPRPREHEVLVETHFSGVTNGTERHALLGEHGWKGQFPSRHGYQHVGRVSETGSDVSGFREGDWVFYGRYVGHRGWNLVDVTSTDQGSYDSHLLMRLPDGIDHDCAALLGVAGVAMRGIRRFRVSRGDGVWVAGAGPIGQFAAQAARAMGAEVTVTEPNVRRLSVAAELGAKNTIDPTEEGYEDRIKRAGPFDCIVDACGAAGLLDDIRRLGVLAHGAVLGLLAVRSDTAFNWSMLHGTEASIEVSCHFSLDDLKVLTALILKQEIRIGPMITHRRSIGDAEKIYSLLRDRPSEVLGIVFDWS